MREPIEIFEDIKVNLFIRYVHRALPISCGSGLIEFDNRPSSYVKIYGKHKGRRRFFGMYNRNNLDHMVCRHPYEKDKSIHIELSLDELIKHGAIESNE